MFTVRFYTLLSNHYQWTRRPVRELIVCGYNSRVERGLRSKQQIQEQYIILSFYDIVILIITQEKSFSSTDQYSRKTFIVICY